MAVCGSHSRKARLLGGMLLALLVCGCSGFQPYEPPKYREQGLEQGLFTGPEGEWVIHRGDRIKKKKKKKTDDEREQ